MSGLPAASKMVRKMISSGTASSAPVVPQTQAQKLRASRIISGLMVSRRPTSVGVTMFASMRCTATKDAAGSSAYQGSEKIIRPPTASRKAEAIGPR